MLGFLNVEPLSNPFNFCIQLGNVPDNWKLARVLPLFKKNEVFVYQLQTNISSSMHI